MHLHAQHDRRNAAENQAVGDTREDAYRLVDSEAERWRPPVEANPGRSHRVARCAHVDVEPGLCPGGAEHQGEGRHEQQRKQPLGFPASGRRELGAPLRPVDISGSRHGRLHRAAAAAARGEARLGFAATGCVLGPLKRDERIAGREEVLELGLRSVQLLHVPPGELRLHAEQRLGGGGDARPLLRPRWLLVAADIGGLQPIVDRERLALLRLALLALLVHVIQVVKLARLGRARDRYVRDLTPVRALVAHLVGQLRRAACRRELWDAPHPHRVVLSLERARVRPLPLCPEPEVSQKHEQHEQHRRRRLVLGDARAVDRAVGQVPHRHAHEDVVGEKGIARHVLLDLRVA